MFKLISFSQNYGGTKEYLQNSFFGFSIDILTTVNILQKLKYWVSSHIKNINLWLKVSFKYELALIQWEVHSTCV